MKAVSDELKRLSQEPTVKSKKREKLKKEKRSKQKDIARLKNKCAAEKISRSASMSVNPRESIVCFTQNVLSINLWCVCVGLEADTPVSVSPSKALVSDHQHQ